MEYIFKKVIKLNLSNEVIPYNENSDCQCTVTSVVNCACPTTNKKE